MLRFLYAWVVLIEGIGLGVAVGGQSSRSATTTKEGVSEVTYTGCVAPLAQTERFVLQNAVPVSGATPPAAGTSGSTPRANSQYLLVARSADGFRPHVGHSVEVTGSISLAKVARDSQDRLRTNPNTHNERLERLPEFHVTSIKSLSDSCE